MNPEQLFRVLADPGREAVRMDLGPWCVDEAGDFAPASLAVAVDALLGAQIHLVGGASGVAKWTVTSELTVDCFADPEPDASRLELQTTQLITDDEGGFGSCAVRTDRGRVIASGLLRSRHVPPLPVMPTDVRVPSKWEYDPDEPEPKSVLDAIGATIELGAGSARLSVAANPALRNFSGVLHGGIVSAAAACAAVAALDSSPAKRVGRYSVVFLRPVSIEDGAVFDATAIQNGRGVGLAEVVSRNEAGKPCAHATVTAYARPTRD